MAILIRRPSRFQQRNARYEVTINGLAVGNALRAIRQVEEQFVDMAGDVQEGACYAAHAFDTVNAHYTGAKKKLRAVKHSAGLR